MCDNKLYEEAIELFPNIKKEIENAINVYKNINSIKDIEEYFLKEYFKENNIVSFETKTIYKRTYKLFSEFTQKINPFKINKLDIKRYYNYLIKKEQKNATIKLRLTILKNIFNIVKNKVFLFNNPFDKVSIEIKKYERKYEKVKKALTEKEVKALLNWLKQRPSLKEKQNYILVLFALSTGLRVSEICNLKWNNLLYFNKRYFIGLIRKGNKKSELEIHPYIVKKIQDLFKKQFNRKPKLEEYLFNTMESYKGKPITPLSKVVLWIRIRDIYKECCENNILRKNLEFSPNIFRRTFATLLNNRGMDIVKLYELMGHSKSSGCLVKHYIDNSQFKKENYLKEIENILCFNKRGI